ncbi:hypothetical protein PILCRDRAFT_817527 [Piloderma croceum F 1598]|uniref:Uncharacterized protein n=1 Tax=Piloderma croceum (strain F 1598) TaxID=765440 RepID=A0A0C3BGS5_PILCF|nr:hypothetical protein PILCRDRAFT_817527 [Piloderma croceum F 1598]
MALAAATDTLKIGPGPKGFAANYAYEISKHRCYERETYGLVPAGGVLSVSLMCSGFNAFAKC